MPALLLLLLIGLVPSPAFAAGAAPAQAGQQVVVGTRVVPPFVIEEPDGSYSGLTVELWEHLARELDLDYRFEAMGIEEMLSGVEEGTLYAAAAALTITADREERLDFTHPFFVTGLGIAVPDRPAGFLQALRALLQPEFLWVILLLVLVLLLWGVLIWVFEREQNREEFGGSPAQGIGSGFWWAAVTMTTVGYGDKAPRTLGGKAVGLLWMFTAIIIISFFTASIASSLTVGQLDDRVTGPGDLLHVRVGALEASAPFAYLQEEGIRPAAYPSIAAGLGALARREIDAFVHDAPILRHQVQEGLRGEVRVLSPTFNRQYYGIALPPGAPERGRINPLLLEYISSEEWHRLTERYLGSEG